MLVCARGSLPVFAIVCLCLPAAPSSAQDAYEPNDTLAASTFVGGTLNQPAQVGTQLLEVDDAILEAGAAADVFSFTCFAGVPIAILLTPREDGGSPLNARNLDFRLWRRTSAANNTFELFAQVDSNAAGEDEVHPPFPYATAGFLAVEVYSSDGLQAVQPYTLRISNAEIPPDIGPPSQQDAHEPNDTLAQNKFVGGTLNEPAVVGTQLLEVDDAILEAGAAVDVFSFTCFAGVPIAIRLTPREDGSNPLNARNLDFRLWRRTSAVNNTFELFAQVDSHAAGEDEVHAPFPYATAGFLAVEVYSSDGLQAPQPYTLRISNAEIPPSGSPDLIVELDGEALPAGATVNLGVVPLGAMSRRALTIRNGGIAPLLFIGRPRVEGEGEDDFKVSGLPAQIEPGAQAGFGIAFVPLALGRRSASLTLLSNDPDSGSFTLLLEGVSDGVAAPEIDLLPAVVDFGEVAMGSVSQLEMAALNRGTATLVVKDIAIAGAGAPAFLLGELFRFPVEVPPGRGLRLPVRFTPPAAAGAGVAFSAELVVTSTDPDEPTTSARLAGTSVSEGAGDPLAGLELELGLPRLESLSFDIVVAGLTVPVQLLLGVDPLGRAIATGPCTVGTVEVEVLGKKLKLRKQTGRWSYQLRLREPETKTTLKVEGELGSGRAKVRYSGPAGKATLTDVLVAEAAALDTVTILSLTPIVDEKGKITGQGWILSGLGNDEGAAPGVLRGKVKGDRVTWTLRQAELKRKVSFKGVIEGADLVGDLKYAIPPGKGRLEGFRMPAVGFVP